MVEYIKNSGSKGHVGIWWITDDHKVFGKSFLVKDGQTEDVFVKCKDGYANCFKQALFYNFDAQTANKYYELGWKGFKRGEVIYDLRTLAFTVTCSEAIYKDIDARRAIVEAFDLYGERYDFVEE